MNDTEVLDTMTRQQMIEYCCWNDPNGCYTDADMLLEFGYVADTVALRTIITEWIIADGPLDLCEWLIDRGPLFANMDLAVNA